MGDAAVGWGRAWSLTSPGPPALAIVEERAGHCNHWAGDDSRTSAEGSDQSNSPSPTAPRLTVARKGFPITNLRSFQPHFPTTPSPGSSHSIPVIPCQTCPHWSPPFSTLCQEAKGPQHHATPGGTKPGDDSLMSLGNTRGNSLPLRGHSRSLGRHGPGL
jgi:hypothetical protein